MIKYYKYIMERGKLMKVAVVMGSKSDYPKVQEGIELLEKFGVKVTTRALSAHRTPIQLMNFLNEIEGNVDVIIGAAGKAAHLPGVIASHTLIPVIGLPIKSSTMDALPYAFVDFCICNLKFDFSVTFSYCHSHF